MGIKNKAALLSLLIIFQLTNCGEVNAAQIDNEMAILAAEQEPQDGVEVFLPEEVKEKSKKELRDEEKKLEEEREEARKKLKEERDKTRDEVNKKKPLNQEPVKEIETPEVEQTEVEPINSTPTVTNTVVDNPVGIPNPVVEYASFEEVVRAVKFTPLYIPKKSGYTITLMTSINGNMAEIRYGRRWEPEVSLHVRTYKRSAGEELKDISGVNGVKWRVDKTTGTSIYIAKINETSHVAAWASGNFTFSAYVQNLSFAAFHSIVADELVDLSNHYYVGI